MSMRGLFVFHRAGRSGACNSLHLLIQGLTDNLLPKDNIIVVFPEPGYYFEYYRQQGYRCYCINKFPSILPSSHVQHRLDIAWKRLVFCAKLTRVIRREQPDFVYVNTFGNSSAYIAAKLSRTTIVWHIREASNIVFANKFSDMIRRNLLRSFPGPFITVSDNTANLLRRLNSQASIVTVYNGVQLPETIVEVSSNDDQVTIGFSGSIVERKGIHTLIEAFRMALSHYPQLRLLLAGPVLDERYFQQLCAKLNGMREQVSFLGFVADMPTFYRGLDIFVLPSQHEPFSRSLLEAMSYGLPVVASDIDGNLEAIEDGVSGRLFRVGNPQDLAEKLRRLVADRELRESLGQRARERVQECFSKEQYVNGVANVIRQVVG